MSELIAQGVLALGDGYRAKNTELGDQGLPFARAGNIDGQFLFDSADKIDIATINVPADKISRPDDTVFTSKGTVGRFARVSNETPRFVYSPQLCYWRSLNKEHVDAGYLYYWLSGPEFYSQYKGVSGQTDMAEYVSLGDQRSMYITLPDISRQRAIAHLLGSIDDKIDLNRRMLATLEEMARVLFKSWFVDFDPVRATAEGRDSGLPAATAALFPDRFGEDGLPVGWEMQSVYGIADVINGAPFSSTLFNTTGVGLPLIRIRDLKDQSPAVWTEESHPAARVINPGDLVVGMDGEFRCYVWAAPAALLNQRVCTFVPRDGLSHPFVRCAIEPLLAQAEASASGTTVIHLGKKDIDRFEVIKATSAVVSAYSQMAADWHRRAVALAMEIRALAKVRDTLLPKLISGDLRIKDMGKDVEAA